MSIDPIAALLLPLLLVILIFVSYQNVTESKRSRKLDEKLAALADHMKIVADKVNEKLS